jgi:hypothetical protein
LPPHGPRAHIACDRRRPGVTASMTWRLAFYNLRREGGRGPIAGGPPRPPRGRPFRRTAKGKVPRRAGMAAQAKLR